MIRACLLVVGLALAGCATFDRMAAPPPTNGAITVSVSRELPSGMSDMPVGVHHVPDSAVYISGHQKGSWAAAPFGLLGLAVASVINEQRGQSLAGSAESAKYPDIYQETERLLAEKIALDGAGAALRLAGGGGGKGAPRVSVLPFVVLTFVSDTEVRPFVVLKVSREDATGNAVWWTRYIGSVAENRVVDGNDGWMADGGRPLREAVLRALGEAADVAVRDLSGKLDRSGTREMKVKTRFAFMHAESQLVVRVLEDDGKRMVLLPRIGDAAVFSGVAVVDKTLVQVVDSAPAGK